MWGGVLGVGGGRGWGRGRELGSGIKFLSDHNWRPGILGDFLSAAMPGSIWTAILVDCFLVWSNRNSVLLSWKSLTV